MIHPLEGNKELLKQNSRGTENSKDAENSKETEIETIQREEKR